jgi:hypothetical protein
METINNQKENQHSFSAGFVNEVLFRSTKDGTARFDITNLLISGVRNYLLFKVGTALKKLKPTSLKDAVTKVPSALRTTAHDLRGTFGHDSNPATPDSEVAASGQMESVNTSIETLTPPDEGTV